MAPTVLQTARIFEDPEPPKSQKPHKRTTSVGDVLRGRRKDESPSKAKTQVRNSHASPSPLGERHINSPPQPKKIPLKGESESRPPMHKKTGSATSLKGFLMGRDKGNSGADSATGKTDTSSKKIKSSTNLAGLLKKRSKKDLKENEPPSALPSPAISLPYPSPSLWSEPMMQSFDGSAGILPRPQLRSRTLTEEIELYTPKEDSDFRMPEQTIINGNSQPSMDFKPPQRPYLEHKSSRSSIFTENLEDEVESPVLQRPKSREQSQSRPSTPPSSPRKSTKKKEAESPEKPENKNRSSRILETIATLNMRPWRNDNTSQNRALDEAAPLSPQDLDSAMENMLGRYDIPQNLRDQLRNLKPEVKAGLMKGERIGSGSSFESEELRPSARRTDGERPSSKDSDKERKQSRSRSRPRSRILSLTKRGDSSPSKQEAAGRARSKSRPKSIDMSRPSSSAAMSSAVSLGSLVSSDSTTTPGDFIHYLREVQNPKLVEVGKIHKLRVLLRNESVAWTDTFIKKGGMDEIINLLYRIMEIEWREEHEDTLLHHCLSCLKGLSTTSLAMQRLEALASNLFPALLKMLFDPERKGPAEYTTRGVIISLLFSYLSSTLHGDFDVHVQRAREVLSYMQDPQPANDNQTLEFVSQMHVARPYRVWHKEVNNVTKEVFWIFLHHLNVVPVLDTINEGETSFARSYFPAARAPHPAAPYVGGVEWEATQYLANHLDLLNGIIVSLPTVEERNALREEFRQSGWEKMMGGSLRTCKEKFYSGVHGGLRAWVAAAKHDHWFVEDVRSGPPREAASPRKSPVKRKAEEAPKIDLDVPMPAFSKSEDAWI